MKRLLIGALVLSIAPRASADTSPHVVALTPLSTLGSEATGATSKKLTAELEAGLGATAVKVIAAAQVAETIKKAKKPQLRACDGEAGCLAEVGKLAGADAIVYGEVGGLGDVQVVYLEIVDVGTGKVTRSTTLQLGAADDPQGGARGAAVRLIAPDKFVGKLAVTVDTAGASIYVDGKRLGKSPAAPVELAVGTHALRVTHPEYRDYVRFVDVPFADQPAQVQVGLQQFPIVERDLQRREGSALQVENIQYVSGGSPPWYRHWYVIAAFGAAAAVGAGAIFDATASGPSADHSRTINPPP